MNEVIIGIDLGTTNSEVAIIRDGQVVVIEENHQKMFPSVVGIGDTGEVLVGEAAKNQYVLYPERTVKSIKRQMGEDVEIGMADHSFTPQEISALILKHLKAAAENYLGQKVDKAVITVPAYFSDAQRQATREAGEIAGLEVLRMINEPTAAALAYEVNQHAHKKILVYDLGGGTFAVSVVAIEENVVEVLASHGNNHLGGDDFDQKIVDYIIEELENQHEVDVSASPQALARVTRAAESAKKQLSDEPFVRIEEEYLLEKDGTPIHLSMELARSDYEQMITEDIDETLDAVHLALQGANLTVSDIDEILLVGGSTRTPLINRLLTELFSLQPHKGIDPDLCVAAGAAIQAAIIAGESIASMLVDITPYTFGTETMGELDGEMSTKVYSPIIQKNSPLPVCKTEAYYTVADGQEQVQITIYQGEAPCTSDNILLGEFMVEGLSDVPSGNVINIKLALDLSGVLSVSACEKDTGLEKSITIDNAMSRLDEDSLELARARIEGLTGDETAPTDIIDPAEAAAKLLLEKAAAALDQAGDEDKDDLIDLMEQINDALQLENRTALAEPVEQLTDVLYYLET